MRLFYLLTSLLIFISCSYDDNNHDDCECGDIYIIEKPIPDSNIYISMEYCAWRDGVEPESVPVEYEQELQEGKCYNPDEISLP